MITKDEFFNLISEYKRWSDKIDKISDVLSISNLFECDWIDYTSILFGNTLNLVFTEEGVDTIYWWLYEKAGRPDFKMWQNDKEIPTETIDDLWEIVKDYIK